MNKQKLKIKRKSSFYDNKVVSKPWGYEYVVYRKSNNLSVTLLNIDYNKSTSLHCHPNKKSGSSIFDANDFEYNKYSGDLKENKDYQS